MDAPSSLSPSQLEELGLSINQKKYSSVYEHLLDLFNKTQVKYQLYEHEPVFTSEAAVAARPGTTLHQNAKALVLTTGKEILLLVLPGDIKADLKALKNTLASDQLKLASPDKVEELTGLKVGAIPPFGSVLGLKTYVDSRLGDNQEITFNVGRHDRSIKMNYHDFINLEHPSLI